MAGDELGDWFAHTTAASASSAPTFDWHRDDAPTSDYNGAYSTFAFRDEALAVIAALGDKRLLLYQAWNAVRAAGEALSVVSWQLSSLSVCQPTTPGCCSG